MTAMKRLDSSPTTVVELPTMQYLSAVMLQAAAPYVTAELARSRALARKLDRALELARTMLPDTFEAIAADRRAVLSSGLPPDEQRAARADLDGRFVALMRTELTELRR
jgi:hypothetical protein